MAVLQSENINFGLPNKTTFLDKTALLNNLLSLRVDCLEEKLFEKADSLDERLFHVEDKIAELESNSILWNDALNILLDRDMARVNTKEKTRPDMVGQNTLAECKKIVSRADEILTEWGGVQDMKVQIQYAAVIVGKIEKMKKKEYIQSNDTRKKICTLLRNVIRLNYTDEIFRTAQIDLLKKGFQLLISENIQKEDMLQLNREFRRVGLMTMPSWE